MFRKLFRRGSAKRDKALLEKYDRGEYLRVGEDVDNKELIAQGGTNQDKGEGSNVISGKDADRFLEKMHHEETRPITKKDRKLAREVQEVGEALDPSHRLGKSALGLKVAKYIDSQDKVLMPSGEVGKHLSTGSQVSKPQPPLDTKLLPHQKAEIDIRNKLNEIMKQNEKV